MTILRVGDKNYYLECLCFNSCSVDLFLTIDLISPQNVMLVVIFGAVSSVQHSDEDTSWSGLDLAEAKYHQVPSIPLSHGGRYEVAGYGGGQLSFNFHG
jgi:hypothetical protein